jgi:prophage maintenance system killer protein
LTGLFLRANGWRLKKQRLDEIQMSLKLAGGKSSEEEFASWIRANCDKYLRNG